MVTDHECTNQILQTRALVLENVKIARDTYRLRLGDKALAQRIRPGQFVMIRPGPPGATDPLLGRPFALYDVVRDEKGEATAIDVVYLIVGRGTSALAGRKPGDHVDVWGPLGNGFGEAPAGDVIFVAGGIGQTPFLALAHAWLGAAEYGEVPKGAERVRSSNRSTSVTLLYGVRSADLLAGIDDFERANVRVLVATDDGTAGHRGYVTELLSAKLNDGNRPARIVACGPPLMLAAVAAIARAHEISCEVSLENHMACGFGACFSCVAPMLQADGSSDLRRVCVEGPVVAAESVDWAAMAH
jgi:dihydroorotate dehydrogenase electron transfer subunit